MSRTSTCSLPARRSRTRSSELALCMRSAAVLKNIEPLPFLAAQGMSTKLVTVVVSSARLSPTPSSEAAAHAGGAATVVQPRCSSVSGGVLIAR